MVNNFCCSILQEDDSPKANCKKKILKVVVTILFILIVVGVVVIWTMHEGRSRKHLGTQYFDFISKKRKLDVYNQNDDIVLNGYLKVSEYDLTKVKDCETGYSNYCFSFQDGTIFKFDPYTIEGTSVNCVNLVWENLSTYLHVPIDCYDIEYGLWYGLPNYKGSFWPLDLSQVSIESMIFQPYNEKVFGEILEGYWLSTEGVAIIAHKDLPYKISFNSGNDKRLCLTLDIQKFSANDVFPNMNYSVCQGPNIKQTFTATRNLFFPHSSMIDYKSHNLSKILWTFQNKYRNNPDNFGEFLHKLNTAHLPINMIEFDAAWEEHRGDLKYEALTKNEISKFLEGKYANVKLMLPITLACSYLSENFLTAASKNLFAKDPESHGFKMVQFSNTYCAVWDASNPETKDFITSEIEDLHSRNSPIPKLYPQAFEFQSLTDASFSVLLSVNSTSSRLLHNEFIDLLLRVDKEVLLQTAYKVQDRPVFVEIPTIVLNKNGKKCLDYIISGALTAGIHGYPYSVSEPPPESKIDQDLFLRWLQVAITFPGLKITNTAVNLGTEVSSLTKNLTVLRESLIVPEISKYIREVGQGFPLIRPLWWINPADYKTLEIADQFLIGSQMMVTPILCHGDKVRDIYIPEGVWVYHPTGVKYKGQRWLKDFRVPFDVIPIFTAEDSQPMTTSVRTFSIKNKNN